MTEAPSLESIRQVVANELSQIVHEAAGKAELQSNNVVVDGNWQVITLDGDSLKGVVYFAVDILQILEDVQTLREMYRSEKRTIFVIIPSMCRPIMVAAGEKPTTEAIEKITRISQDGKIPSVCLYSDLALSRMQKTGWQDCPDDLAEACTFLEAMLKQAQVELDPWDFSGIMEVVREYQKIIGAIYRLCFFALLKRFDTVPQSITFDRQMGELVFELGSKTTRIKASDPAWMTAVFGFRLYMSSHTVNQALWPIVYSDHQGALRNLRALYEEVFQLAHRLLQLDREASNWLKTPLGEWAVEGSGKNFLMPWKVRENVYRLLLAPAGVTLEVKEIHQLYTDLCRFTHNDLLSTPTLIEFRDAYRIWNPYFMSVMRIILLVVGCLYGKLASEAPDQKVEAGVNEKDEVLKIGALVTLLGTFFNSVHKEMVSIADARARKLLTKMLFETS